MTPLPSIATIEFLIPYVGDELLLRESVTSVRQQTDPRWSLKVVEDGPQDTSVAAWLDGLHDCRVQYLLNSTTLGVAANFQRCLELATSENVVFLGCDDRLLPRYVETMRRASDTHPSVAAIQPGVRVIDEHGNSSTPTADRLKALLAPRIKGQRLMVGEPLLTSLMRGNWTYFPAIMWRRERLLRVGFRQDLPTALDLVALATLVLEGEELLCIEDPAFEYRRHRASASSLAAARTDRFVEERRVFQEIGERARRHGWRRAARAAQVRLASRLHAASLVPTAVLTRNWTASRRYTSHWLGR